MKIGNQVSVFALALALSAAVPALAQDATDTTTAPDPTLTDPAVTGPALDPAADPAAAAVPEPAEGSKVTVVDVDAGAPQGLLADTDFSTMTAKDLLGKSIVNAEGETIGDIDDIVFDTDHKAMFAIVQVGGFLGIGSKAVAISFNQLQLSEDQATLMSSLTEDELTEMAAYSDGAYQQVEDNETFGQLNNAGDAVVGAGEDVADAGAEVVDEANSPDLAATTDTDMAPDESEMDTGVATTVDEQEPAAGQAADTAAEPAMEEESAVARESPFAHMTAEDLIGKDVVNTAGEDIGEIKDLVISDDKAVQAVISVGGFLGIGDKDVAVPLEDLQVGEDEAVLTTGLTKEDLENMKDYQDEWPHLEGDQPVYSQ